MRSSKTKNYNHNTEALSKLLQAILNDPVVNNKVRQLLKLNSYPRRIVLSNWLEQLHQKKASEKLIEALTLLFDDKPAKQVLDFINKHN